MKIFLRLLLSAALTVAFLSALFGTVERISGLATIPILFNGAVGGSVNLYNNSMFPVLYYVTNYPVACNGIWSCSNMICELFTKKGTKYVALKPNINNITNLPPCSKNINTWLEKWFEYKITYYSLIFASISSAIAICISFLILIFKYKDNKDDIIIINQFEEKTTSRTMSIVIYIILFAFRSPVYISMLLLYTYLIPNLKIVDDVPSQIQTYEYIKLFSLLAAYFIDNVISPLSIISY